MSKRYYWLKLNQNFFDSSEIKVLKSMENGSDYIVFWQELLLSSLSYTEETQKIGLLAFKENIPWSQDLMESVFGYSKEIITGALNIFQKLGMVTITESGEIWANSFQEMVGSETTEALRKREYRAKTKELETSCKRDIVPTLSHDGTLSPELSQNCPVEIEKEKDNNSDIDDSNEESVVDGFEVITKTYQDLGLSFQLFKIEHHCKIYGIDTVKECLKSFSEVDLNKINKSPEAYFMGMLKNYVPGIKITPSHIIKQQETKKRLEELRACGEKINENKLTLEQIREYTKKVKDIAEKSDSLDKKNDSDNVDAKQLKEHPWGVKKQQEGG